MRTLVILALLACCLPSPSRVFAQDNPTAQSVSEGKPLPLNMDPNDPSASPEERMARQKKLIMQHIAERTAAIKNEHEKINNESRLHQLIAAAPVTSATEPILRQLPAMMKELQDEISRLRVEVQSLMNKAEPQLSREAETQKPASRTYRAQAQVTVEGGKKMDLLSYAEREFSITAPLIVVPAAGSDLTTQVGSFGLSCTFEAAGSDKVLVQYQVTMSVPVTEIYTSPDKKSRSAGQMTVQYGTQGKSTLKFGEAKEIVHIGGNKVILTVTPD